MCRAKMIRRITIAAALFVIAQIATAVAEPVKGLPILTADEVVALREHLGIDPKGKRGRTGQSGKLRAIQATLSKMTSAADAARSARQVALGLPKKTVDVGAPTVFDPQGRWLGEVSDVVPIEGHPGALRAGAIWQAWVTKQRDVIRLRKRPRSWNEPRVPNKFALKNMSMDWRGLFAETSTHNLENGMSRGHVMPNASATFSKSDQKRTFRLYSNAFPQSRDSNAGAWRNLEKTIQDIARSGDYVVYNYSGVLWQTAKYTRLDGSPAKVEPEVIEFGRGRVPKPTAYWRVAIIVPVKGPDGQPWDVADGLSYARPLAVIVPNAQDADLFVSDWSRFSTTIADVEKRAGLELLTHLDGAPMGKELLGALRTHKDSGVGLPREKTLPKWKKMQLRQLISNPASVSSGALVAARKILRSNTSRSRSGKSLIIPGYLKAEKTKASRGKNARTPAKIPGLPRTRIGYRGLEAHPVKSKYYGTRPKTYRDPRRRRRPAKRSRARAH